jgi:hypothetical protein
MIFKIAEIKGAVHAGRPFLYCVNESIGFSNQSFYGWVTTKLSKYTVTGAVS